MGEPKHVELRPGWLHDQLIESGQLIRLNHDPSHLVSIGLTVTLPLSDEDAADLYKRMDARFRAWTGRSLHAPAPSPAERGTG